MFFVENALSEDDRELINAVDLNNHFNHQGNGYYFNHSVWDTRDYLSLPQMQRLFDLVFKYGTGFLRNWHYVTRPIYWQRDTYYVPTGEIQGTFPDSGCYGAIYLDGRPGT